MHKSAVLTQITICQQLRMNTEFRLGIECILNASSVKILPETCKKSFTYVCLTPTLVFKRRVILMHCITIGLIGNYVNISSETVNWQHFK